ncbi:hypothetical protein U1Q18_048151, partial [Sarracenia purpurea var. burkii]
NFDSKIEHKGLNNGIRMTSLSVAIASSTGEMGIVRSDCSQRFRYRAIVRSDSSFDIDLRNANRLQRFCKWESFATRKWLNETYFV